MGRKHKPTPWRAECWTSHAKNTVLVSDKRAGIAGKLIIAECCGEEDAAFIVSACNAHADLVAALIRLCAAEAAPRDEWIAALANAYVILAKAGAA